MIGNTAGCNPEVNLTSEDGYITLGNVTASCFAVSTGLVNPSDKRDKTDVADLDLGLDYIKALRPVYYRWDKRAWYDDSGTPHGTSDELNTFLDYEPDGTRKRNKWEIGLLAQEALAAEKLHTSKVQVKNSQSGKDLEPTANDGLVVGGSVNDGYNMSYQVLIMPLIKSVKELDAKIVTLAARVTDLE
jgi:hypothetical protein